MSEAKYEAVVKQSREAEGLIPVIVLMIVTKAKEVS